MTLDAAPKAIPRKDEYEVATAAEAAEEAWFGSNKTPAKNPEVTINAAVRERLDGHCWRWSAWIPLVYNLKGLERGGT